MDKKFIGIIAAIIIVVLVYFIDSVGIGSLPAGYLAEGNDERACSNEESIIVLLSDGYQDLADMYRFQKLIMSIIIAVLVAVLIVKWK